MPQEDWQKKQTKITWSEAERILAKFIRETDADTLAFIFEKVFGYDIEIPKDDEDDIFLCTPNPDCGYVLGENPEWKML